MQIVRATTRMFFLVALLASSVTPGCRTEGGAGAGGGGAAVVRVDGAEAHRLVAAGATLVDVRTPEEFADGHAEGARNIPVHEVASRAGEISRDHPVVVYCASGARSAQAAATLSRMGYRVHDLGTLNAWRQ